MKKYLLIFGLIIIFIIAIVSLNKQTITTISINYNPVNYNIPLYLKFSNFINRHNNYKYFISEINEGLDSPNEIILNLSKWIYINIKKIPPDGTIDVVDSHPITILNRRLGVNDQFNDLLSLLLVYSKIDAFYKSYTINSLSNFSITYFRTHKNWSIIDPYYGVYFLNEFNEFANINELKNKNINMINFKFGKINENNFKKIFGSKFNTFDQVRIFYSSLFNQLLPHVEINQANKFNLGGRS